MKLYTHFFCRNFSQLAAVAVALVILPGCGGYYNTFYNTKKVYKEAAEERKRRTGTENKPGSGEIQKYDKAIEKASKLLQLHPNSRYVDDALLLIGECFFYKQEYLKAQRKFQELITLFPKSGLAPRAQLWLAKANIELNDFSGAEQVLKDLEEREKKGEMVNQARYLLGEIYFRREQYTPAAQEYDAAARKLGDAKIRGEAYMRLGECYVALEQYGPAADAFRRAGSSIENDVNLKFTARLQYATALKDDQKLNEALRVLNAMLKEYSMNRDLPLVKVEIAECNRAQGKIETAIRQYTAIIENHQRTDASAAAFFALGEIHERQTGDFAKAKENYDNVRRESSRYEKLPEAERRSKAIAALIKLKENVASLERQRSALAGGKPEASLRSASNDKDKKPSAERAPISRIPRRAKNVNLEALASGSATKDPQKVAAELAKSKILLAELYLFNFNRPDSAMREYLDVFEFFPQTEYAPQAMYSLAYILGEAPATLAMRDSILIVLAGKYGQTPQGQSAKRLLGRADTLSAGHTLPELLRQAEASLVERKNPQRAVQMYQEFLQRQPDSKYAAQSLYAMGWIYEHELADNRQALAAYKKLVEAYPESPMARRVRPKVTAAEQPVKLAAAPPDSHLTVLPDSNLTAPPEEFAPPDSQETALPDSEQIATPVIEDEMLLKDRPKNIRSAKPRPLVDDELDRPLQDKEKKEDEPSKKDEEKKDVPPQLF